MTESATDATADSLKSLPLTILYISNNEFHGQQDINDDIVAYRIETHTYEIILAGNTEAAACVVLKNQKKRRRLKGPQFL